VATVVVLLRTIIWSAQAPTAGTLLRLTGVSCLVFAIGLTVFRRLKPMFYEHI
jgi:hypothetical protein